MHIRALLEVFRSDQTTFNQSLDTSIKGMKNEIIKNAKPISILEEIIASNVSNVNKLLASSKTPWSASEGGVGSLSYLN